MSDPIWPVSTDLVEEVLHTWQNAETSDDTTDAEALVDALAHHGLQILPTAPAGAPCVVEVDGEALSRPGMPSPHPANEAAGLWLAAYAEGRGRVVLRPATDEETAAADARDREILRRDLGRESVPQPCLLHQGDARHYVDECRGGGK